MHRKGKTRQRWKLLARFLGNENKAGRGPWSIISVPRVGRIVLSPQREWIDYVWAEEFFKKAKETKTESGVAAQLKFAAAERVDERSNLF